MDIQGISATDAAFGGIAGTGQTLGRDAFLDMLVQQLRNQDPLQPTANEDFIAQLAQFSSLEEMEELNENVVGMVVLQQGNALMEQLTSSSSLIGHTVNFLDPATLSPASGTVQSVKLEDGIAVLNVDGRDVPLVNVSEVLEVADGATGDDGAPEDGADAEQ